MSRHLRRPNLDLLDRSSPSSIIINHHHHHHHHHHHTGAVAESCPHGTDLGCSEPRTHWTGNLGLVVVAVGVCRRSTDPQVHAVLVVDNKQRYTVTTWAGTQMSQLTTTRTRTTTTTRTKTTTTKQRRQQSFNGQFPWQPRQAGTRVSPFSILLQLRMMEMVSGDNWSCKTCKALPPTNQQPAFDANRYLRCALASYGAVYCNRSCLWVCLCVCLCVCASVTTIARNCVHRSSPNWVCR